MSEHRIELDWKRETESFAYKDYSRNHTWKFENGEVIKASAAVEFLGDPGCVDPEAAFTASLSSCHALTFLAIAAMQKLTVDSYRDDPSEGRRTDPSRSASVTSLGPRSDPPMPMLTTSVMVAPL